MAANVKNPLYFKQNVQYAQTVNLAVAGTPTEACIGITLGGALPSAKGDKVAGIVNYYDERNEYASVAQVGVTIAKVKAAAIIAVGDALTIDTDGTAVEAAGTESIVGYALDSSDGSGTNSIPHYVRINLNLA